MTKYEVLQLISLGEDGTLSRENAELVILANDIFTATRSSGDNEGESSIGTDNVIKDLVNVILARPSVLNKKSQHSPSWTEEF